MALMTRSLCSLMAVLVEKNWLKDWWKSLERFHERTNWDFYRNFIQTWRTYDLGFKITRKASRESNILFKSLICYSLNTPSVNIKESHQQRSFWVFPQQINKLQSNDLIDFLFLITLDLYSDQTSNKMSFLFWSVFSVSVFATNLMNFTINHWMDK